MGVCVDNTWYVDIDFTKLSNKYITIYIPTDFVDITSNEFKYCYNSGQIDDNWLTDESAGILRKRMIRSTESYTSRTYYF